MSSTSHSLNQQNRLPKNVDYKNMDKSERRTICASSFAYHAERKELYAIGSDTTGSLVTSSKSGRKNDDQPTGGGGGLSPSPNSDPYQAGHSKTQQIGIDPENDYDQDDQNKSKRRKRRKRRNSRKIREFSITWRYYHRLSVHKSLYYGTRWGRVIYGYHETHEDEPTDLAISSDGKFIYLLTYKSLVKLDLNGFNCIEDFRECTLGKFESCKTMISHNNHILVLESSYKCVIVYENDQEVRHFNLGKLSDPSSMAISNSGQVYIVDNGYYCVRVFELDGTYVETILETDFKTDDGLDHREDSITAIAVDGDDYICLARYSRIDVYNTHRDLVTSISMEYSSPDHLAFTPDGTLIVHDGHEIRILR